VAVASIWTGAAGTTERLAEASVAGRAIDAVTGRGTGKVLKKSLISTRDG
jgi:hypothetical protein